MIAEDAVRRALATVPGRFSVYDRQGALALDLGGDAVHFDPGSACLFLLEGDGTRRRARAADLSSLAWITEACRGFAAQATALVPEDVPEALADRYRLWAALKGSRKPVVTGTFVREGFRVMLELLVAVRGGAAALRERPLAIFDCCPTAPLTWSDLTCQALVDCAESGIPAQLVAMPMTGATAPVTLREEIVQHCAESLSGVVIHQLAGPGSPLVYGGSPAAFDMRHGTTPMGAVETWMIDVGYAQVGRRLGMPTHAYMGPSDAKLPDYQAGMESGLGLVLAALGGVNLVSGPGMLDFENCQSFAKLLLDNEVALMAQRLVRGIGPGSAGETVDLIRQVVALGSFLGHRHTRANFRTELHIPGPLVDRGTHGEWEAAGARDAWQRASEEAARILARGNPAPLEVALERELDTILLRDARRHGAGSLPLM